MINSRARRTGDWPAIALALCLVATLFPRAAVANPFTASQRGALGTALDSMLRRCRQSVVLVVSSRPNPPLSGLSPIGVAPTALWANGVVVDSEGGILTCADSAQPQDSLYVLAADGSRRKARFVAQEVKPGMSLIRVVDSRGLVPIERKPDLAGMREGAWMIVFGFDRDLRPDFRLARLETPGVSADGRVSRAFRVSLASNGGTCGGVVLDELGEYRGVAINVEVPQSDGPPNGGCPERARQLLNAGSLAAISMDELSALRDRLERAGENPAGFVGLLVQAESSPASAPPAETTTDRDSSVRVTGVVPGSPAERAGFVVGDRILTLDGEAVSRVDQVTERIRAASPGVTVVLGVRRGERLLSLSTPIGDYSSYDWMERQKLMTRSWEKRLRLSLAFQQDFLQKLELSGSRYP